ncbi:hypothetical protein [Mesorhizobium muleiense]|uniref:Uncharacterized protein n=1 Tax=Mesorhizobium muleiense TaxID=1004279 RepID=A0A1G8UQ55_9HYPH|nr:hypothetical protein [Mesorhizobium muleiense]MCF6102319.1 hypothetical protein [Mesorhizobium muleiense]SDJ55859.1 hypothetical protein SAMN05428953_10762 [Mesorhizobium muleiense]
MTPERFSELVAAYGGSPQRWPENERTAALDFIAANPAQAEAALAPAVELDDLLSRHRVAAPDDALARRIIATAPSALWRRTQLVWRCAGLAGIGLAGALAGALTVAVLLPPNSAPDDGDTYALTAFGDMQGDVQ